MTPYEYRVYLLLQFTYTTIRPGEANGRQEYGPAQGCCWHSPHIDCLSIIISSCGLVSSKCSHGLSEYLEDEDVRA